MLKTIFLPWLVIADLRGAQDYDAETIHALSNITHEQAKEIRRLRAYNLSLATEAHNLKAQLAKFDHDGDGKAGGSKKR